VIRIVNLRLVRFGVFVLDVDAGVLERGAGGVEVWPVGEPVDVGAAVQVRVVQLKVDLRLGTTADAALLPAWPSRDVIEWQIYT
jgi:hypothetical protein